MLKNKTVVLGVSGSIAAYKMANVASMLVKLHAQVHVIMTKNACQFITPVTFETLTGHKCLVDTFDRNFEFQVEHVSLAGQADVFLVAPASADVIGKIAGGICDDMLTTTIMACKAPKLIAPAMNTRMWENPILQDNLKKLQHYGYQVIQPAAGRLACGDTGCGKLPSEQELVQQILLQIACPHDFSGKKVLISAGPTCEAIDPVRFITNHSSGKMGYALARMARLRGAEVTLVSGPVHLEAYPGVKVVPVQSAADMFQAVTSRSGEQDIVIMSSAVADYTPVSYHEQKTKKSDGEMSIPLKRTQDILQYLGQHRTEQQVLVGFSMETENLLAYSQAKLQKKNCDLICANSISRGTTGFGVDTNQVTLLTRQGQKALPLCSKEETANLILNEILILK